MDDTISQRRFFSLVQVAESVRAHLKGAIDKRFWLKAEISSQREWQGAFFCDLVETDNSGKQVAKFAARIWSRELTSIRQSFRRAALDLQLDNGTEVGICCSLQFDASYGVYLKVHDADPAFALGELEIRRREILLKLESDGLFEPNKRLAVRLLPQRIGVVTSRSSAAFSDFSRTFEQSPYGFTLITADAVMQGRQTESSIISSIDAVIQCGVELIVIIRGGGSKTDLAYLDNDVIARKIAHCPIPVWTGIGHEVDTSVLDRVANAHFKTPTAVAVELVYRFSKVSELVNRTKQRLQSTWQLRVQFERKSLVRSRIGLRQGTRKLLDGATSCLTVTRSSVTEKLTARLADEYSRLNEAKSQLLSVPRTVLVARAQYLIDAKRRCRVNGNRGLESRKQELHSFRDRFREERYLARLTRERDGLRNKQRLVRSADPVNNLQRGYSLSYDKDGRLVKSVHNIKQGDGLTVVVGDGVINSTVDRVKVREDD